MIESHRFSHLIPKPCPPEPDTGLAVFLGLDGTLLDLAPAPNKVVVPDNLKRDLAAASVALGGAMAIFSGRSLADVDSLLSPLRFPGGGEHGAILRMPDGRCDEIGETIPREWIDALTYASGSRAGTTVEVKKHSVTMHFRRAAHEESFFHKMCCDLVAERANEFEVVVARMAIEVRPRTASKARAIRRLMMQPPFSERRAIFIGDNFGDADGFRSVESLGGEGLDVFARFGGRPKEVRGWLKRLGATA